MKIIFEYSKKKLSPFVERNLASYCDPKFTIFPEP